MTYLPKGVLFGKWRHFFVIEKFYHILYKPARGFLVIWQFGTKKSPIFVCLPKSTPICKSRHNELKRQEESGMRKRIISAMLAVCLLLTILPNLTIEAQATATEAPGMAKGYASGTVADANTGFYIRGVTVNAYTTNGILKASTTTDSYGRYKIVTNLEGFFNLEFTHDGYTAGKLERVQLGSIETTHDMKLSPPNGSTATVVIDSGSCGENVIWKLDNRGILTISGKGRMRNYRGGFGSAEEVQAPWLKYMNNSKNKYTAIIENGVTNIGAYAFADCANLTNITIADTVTLIDSLALYKTCISNISIPQNVTTIGDKAFGGSYNLAHITIPPSVTEVGAAFYDCRALKTITISKSVKQMSTYAFINCTRLEDVYYSGTEQEWNQLYPYKLCKATIHFNSTGPTGDSVTTPTPKPTPPINATPNPKPTPTPDIEPSPQPTLSPIPSPKPTPGDNTKLQSLANEWKNAYGGYSRALKQRLVEIAKTENDPNSLNELAERFENRLWKKYGLELDATNFDTSERVLVYKAILEMMSEYSGSEALKFNDISTGNLNKFSIEIANRVAHAFQTTSYQYVDTTNKGIKVNIYLNDFGGGKLGEATILQPGKYSKTTSIISSYDNLNGILTEYMDELVNLEEVLAKKAAKEIYQDLTTHLFGKSLDKISKAFLENKLAQHTPRFLPMGLGDVSKAINDCCNYYKFLKNVSNMDTDDLMLMLEGVKDISFNDPSVTDNVIKQALEDLETLRKSIEQTITGEPTEKDSFWWDLLKGSILYFKCPVSVAVYDSTGSQVGYVGDDDLWYNDSVYIEKNGDVKTVYTNGAVSFKITGTDYGTLNCTYEEYENGAATRRINYYDIPVETGKELNATISEDGKNVVLREASGQTLSPNETVPAADYQKSTVSISVNASGGDVQGAGKYVKGDSVQLLASPQTGYRFIGWQSQDGSLIEINQLYEFTARENTSFTAVFARDTTQHSFIDVTSDDWYAESVQYVYENGLMAGTSATTFTPNSTTTRGQLVTILYRMEGEPPVNNADRFDDVPSGQWYTNAVAWAADNGIVSGYGNRKYGPHDGITREQMVTILHRYADSKKVDTSKTASLEKYIDQKQISTYAVASVQWAVGEGLITGTSQTTLSPTDTSTRAQVAAILQRYGEKFPTVE